VDALCAMPRPHEGEASFETVALPNGDVALLALTAVQDADAATAGEAELRRVRERLRDAAAGAEFAAFRGQIEQGIKVRVIRSAEEDAPLQ
jgi:peptidyl-prolyl cis-trans isomerase D